MATHNAMFLSKMKGGRNTVPLLGGPSLECSALPPPPPTGVRSHNSAVRINVGIDVKNAKQTQEADHSTQSANRVVSVWHTYAVSNQCN